MSSSFIPSQFVKSCQAHESYPLKLVGRARYGVPLLTLCKERFEQRQRRQDLFVKDSEMNIPYWDVLRTGQVQQENIQSETELGEWLGDIYQPNPNDESEFFGAKEDVACRFV
jgi:hypothetical protein